MVCLKETVLETLKSLLSILTIGDSYVTRLYVNHGQLRRESIDAASLKTNKGSISKLKAISFSKMLF
ncbi:hypothetical protein Gasu2_40460 [Galdieria sulphuraria]|uniref:Uncharacterized protein n=1 Tax=Galdieria sulphuraria TaxID=130081 RepID=M2Y805_GALSU|nr:uncharacterized protein Gasu_07090 [Galdieria sulphuraria]EME31959.1 hypothetical protein Gasu_07090 [Galdieria sulphuraria]GJD09817.1 hypothetical protein Gasu2_40460 [Galdieria sulphuraria]|eukprot:XP_005708479.1 hypothetical protein Gasu_07090 [Galdieria sulphuraria]